MADELKIGSLSLLDFTKYIPDGKDGKSYSWQEIWNEVWAKGPAGGRRLARRELIGADVGFDVQVIGPGDNTSNTNFQAIQDALDAIMAHELNEDGTITNYVENWQRGRQHGSWRILWGTFVPKSWAYTPGGMIEARLDLHLSA